ncbi:MAG: hypothetical protein JXO44_08505 [Clostridia bacterium]|nr:hypothetical protein [Clostridia bacterium]
MKFNSHVKSLAIAVAITAIIFIGQKAFSVVFQTVFIILFLMPIVIFARALSSGKKLKALMANYHTTEDVTAILQITEFFAKKRYHAGIDYHFFNEMKAFYALVEANEEATPEILNNLKQALSNYNVKIDDDAPMIRDALLIENEL